MKTVDLIPIILYQLKEEDKYGLEIVDAINKCSQNKIDVKQTTLYPLLKKLEKSRFISSYWQDSEIGGKRHYYKITENGLSQLETYPALTELLKNLEENEAAEPNIDSPALSEAEKGTKNQNEIEGRNTDDQAQEDEKNQLEAISYMPQNEFISHNIDIATSQIENEHIDNNLINLPSKTVNFLTQEANNSPAFDPEVDKTEKNEPKKTEERPNNFDIFDILSFDDEKSEAEKARENTLFNKQTSEISSPSLSVKQEVNLINPFEDNQKIGLKKEDTQLKNQENIKTSFEEKSENLTIQKNIYNNKKSPENFSTKAVFESKTIGQQITKINEENIEYRDYIDYKNDSRVIETKKNARLKLLRNISSNALSILWLNIMLAFCIKTKITPLFSVVYSLSTLYVVFNFCKFVGGYRAMQLDIANRKIKYNFKKQIIIRAIFSGACLLVLFLLNVIFLKDGGLFSKNNFGNFLAPIILLILPFFDYLFAFIFFRGSIEKGRTEN